MTAGSSVVVPIVVANPVRQVAVDGFVASLWRNVKEGVATETHLAAVREGRVTEASTDASHAGTARRLDRRGLRM
jgi:hypothetical protein